jgi:hypothetical protein
MDMNAGIRRAFGLQVAPDMVEMGMGIENGGDVRQRQVDF